MSGHCETRSFIVSLAAEFRRQSQPRFILLERGIRASPMVCTRLGESIGQGSGVDVIAQFMAGPRSLRDVQQFQ